MTPPASEESNKHDSDNASSSELSEMELDEDDDKRFKNHNSEKMEGVEGGTEEVVPDHYYGDGRVPVFKPVRNSRPHPRYCSQLAIQPDCCLSEASPWRMLI